MNSQKQAVGLNAFAFVILITGVIDSIRNLSLTSKHADAVSSTSNS